MGVATGLLIAAGVSAGINAYNQHKSNKTAEKIATNEQNAEMMAAMQRQQDFQRMLPLLSGQWQQTQDSYRPWTQQGAGANAALHTMMNRPGPPPSAPPQPQNPFAQFQQSLPADWGRPVGETRQGPNGPERWDGQSWKPIPKKRTPFLGRVGKDIADPFMVFHKFNS